MITFSYIKISYVLHTESSRSYCLKKYHIYDYFLSPFRDLVIVKIVSLWPLLASIIVIAKVYKDIVGGSRLGTGQILI